MAGREGGADLTVQKCWTSALSEVFNPFRDADMSLRDDTLPCDHPVAYSIEWGG